MKKQKKHSNITIFLTKRNLLFWKWKIFFIYNIMVSLLFLLIPAGGLFAAMIQGDLAAVLIRLDKDFWLMLFSGMVFSIIFPDICYLFLSCIVYPGCSGRNSIWESFLMNVLSRRKSTGGMLFMQTAIGLSFLTEPMYFIFIL